jgi:hypothetical protein
MENSNVHALHDADLIQHHDLVAETLLGKPPRANVREWLEAELLGCEIEMAHRAALLALVTGKT